MMGRLIVNGHLINKILNRSGIRGYLKVYGNCDCSSVNTCQMRTINSISLHSSYIQTYSLTSQLKCNNSRLFCSKYKADTTEKHVKNDLKKFIKINQEKLKDTEQKLKQKGSVLLHDIKETKNKVKGKVEEVIERENVYTIPNFLCIARMLLSPYLGMLIVQADFTYALGILGVAAVTDLLDGWIARTWVSQSSKMGSFLDPMADKVLIASLFLSLTYAELIPIVLTAMIIARDVLLVIAGFVIRYYSLPPPKTLSRYFDVTHATAQLAPTFISKVNTGVQLLLVGSTLAAPVFQYVGHPLLECLWYVTGATTIAAGASYLVSKDTYTFLKKQSTK